MPGVTGATCEFVSVGKRQLGWAHNINPISIMP
eukprot:COSAG02_NODE_49644_length_325_cov_1.119469_1_plen_32_part_01